MAEKIRFKCPCCGMVSDLDRLDDGPYKIKVYRQEFGGKVPGERHGRGRARGLMKYTDITSSSVEIQREIEEMIKKTYQSIKNRKSRKSPP
jgi:hypothetical protein